MRHIISKKVPHRMKQFTTCFEHIVEMSRILIGKVYMGPNHVFPIVCRNRAWSQH
jgi:hypothetical protein